MTLGSKSVLCCLKQNGWDESGAWFMMFFGD